MNKDIDFIYRFMVLGRIEGTSVVNSHFWEFRYLFNNSRWWIIPGPDKVGNFCYLHVMGENPATNVKMLTWTFIDCQASDTTDTLCMLLDNLGLKYYVYGNEKRGWEVFLNNGNHVGSLSKLRKKLNEKT